MSHFRYKSVYFAVLTVLGVGLGSAFAHPAAPNSPKTVKNADSSEVTVQFYGDEHYHYATTQDGYLVVPDSGSFVYANENGEPSRVKARNKEKRSESDRNFLKGISQEKVRKMHRARHVDEYPEEESATASFPAPLMAPAAQNRPAPATWVTGERWIPVLLIGTTDIPYADSSAVDAMLNEEGYSVDGNIGSLRDYYLYSSGGNFNPHFDVYPLQLDVPLTSFGSGSAYSEGNFTKAGIEALTAREDFKANAAKYCFSGTSIDGFIFLFPGEEVNALKQSSNFWGHKYQMRYNGAGSSSQGGYVSGGYTFDAYLFIAQYDDNRAHGDLNAMGIFAHEFSHVLGLKDLYYSTSSVAIRGPEPYDVMTRGMYNDNWQTPPAFSAFERESMGWLTLKELSADSVYSLKPLSQMEAYSVSNPNHTDEYYVVEYRPAEKYDAHITKNQVHENGIYVWYIDYDQSAFGASGSPNKDSTHQRVAMKGVLNADGYYADFSYVNASGVANIPGIYKVSVIDGQVCFATGSNLSVTCEILVSSSSSAPEIVQESSSSTVGIRQLAELPCDEIKTFQVFDLMGNKIYTGSAPLTDLSSMLPKGKSYVVRVSFKTGMQQVVILPVNK